MRHARRGNAMIETAMFVPIFILLLAGTVEIARVTWVYFQAQKTLYNLGRVLGTTTSFVAGISASTGRLLGSIEIALGLWPWRFGTRMRPQRSVTPTGRFW